MCGITGFYSYKNRVNTKQYYEAHKKIAHRGPDDEGFLYKNNKNELDYLIGDDSIGALHDRGIIYQQDASHLILGHRRLSIIDLSAHGHQPYVYEHLSLVYNGEIYNYIELREELQLLGYRFDTSSDTEVFLKAYHCWGVESFNKFNGMWASAIYDNDKDELLLVRDRFGIKPLYYSMEDNNLIFSSEIKFLTSFFNQNFINKSLVFSYLRYCHLEHSNETFIENIFSLAGGTYLLYSKEGIKKQFFYNLARRDKINIEQSLSSGLKLRMRSDVEVGALLSGGIDSSTLVCMLHSKFGIKKFKTFTADFKEKAFSEKNYVKNILEQTGYEGYFIQIQPEDIVKNMEIMMYIHETPVRSMSVFLQYNIFQYIKIHTNVKVTLSGQGADEIFSGYTGDYYYYLISLFLEKKFKIFFKEFLIIKNKLGLNTVSLSKSILVNYLHEKFSKKDKYNLFNEDIPLIEYTSKYKNFLKDKLYKGLSFSALQEYLRDEDKNSMHFSIESRLPYLDYNLVEEAFSLNENEYVRKGETKYMLKEIAKKMIPQSIINRKDKMGFVSPQEIWQKKELKEEFDNVFISIREEGLFSFLNHEEIYKLYTQYQEGSFHDWGLIWRFYCLYYYKKVWNLEEVKKG